MTNDRKILMIKSGTELVNNPVPSIKYRILGLLRANGARMSITGQYKMRKSLLAHDLAFRVAAGEDWLCFKTTKGKVLYVNLEIAEEKFQERTQDLQSSCSYDSESLEGFREVTILDSNLRLDSSIETIQYLLNECKTDNFKVDMLILDPRARSISDSENEEVVIKRFCANIDTLLKNNKGLSIVIVTHMGKDPSKGAIGHSRYSGWLDSEIKISQHRTKPKIRSLDIISRDSEDMHLSLEFKYPLHTIVEEEEFARKTKVDEAADYILTRIA